MTNKKVLTLQDISCVGQCSITVALPIISACGIETAVIPAAVLSSHTGGFKGYTVRDLTEDIPGIMNHWISEGIKFDCLYTGYLANTSQIDYVLSLRKKVITKDGLLIVDPAMADNGCLYSGFNMDFVKEMGRLCGQADIILPNMTEAALLTDSEILLDLHREEYVLSILKKLSLLGAKKIVLKGIHIKENEIGVAVYDSESGKTRYYFTKKMKNSSPGTGDCYAAAFTGALMQEYDLLDAARIAADFVVESIKQTADDPSHWYGVKFERALPTLVNRLNN